MAAPGKMRVKLIFICKKYGSARKNASKNIFTYNECSTKGSKNIFTYNEARPSSNRRELTDEPNERTAQHIT